MVRDVAKTGLSARDGTVSSINFRIGANAFGEIWNKFSSSIDLPHCSWVPSPRCPQISTQGAEGYLSLENVLICSSSKEDKEERIEVQKEVASCSNQDEVIDGASLVPSYANEVHRFDFHIVYSSSYRVPVLYFRAYNIDGQPLALDEIEKDLSADSAKLVMQSKWAFITQEEHPYLNRPWYTLHPCGTSEWMKLLLDADSSQATGEPRFDKYLFSWFSVVGQVFDLRIPIEMANFF